MAKLAKQGVDLRYAEEMRRCAWSPGSYRHNDKGDWDRTKQCWPPSIYGSCRHKVSWLRQTLGGEIYVGKRTDRTNAQLHAVLAIRIHEHDWILDEDGLWPAKSFPFARELWPPKGYWEGD
jgi:hypothetical protein